MQKKMFLNLWYIFCKCFLVDQCIFIDIEKMTNVNQVLSVLRQIGIYFIASLFNHNHKYYNKMNLDVQTLSFSTHTVYLIN